MHTELRIYTCPHCRVAFTKTNGAKHAPSCPLFGDSPAENSEATGASEVKDEQGVSTLTIDRDDGAGRILVESWRNTVDAEQVATDAWNWLRDSGRKTLPSCTLESLCFRELARIAIHARDCGSLLHLVPA